MIFPLKSIIIWRYVICFLVSCGDILHADINYDKHGDVPAGWVLCYIDETDTAYHNVACRDLLQNIVSAKGERFADSQTLLNSGGNFGCWHGTSGSVEGAATTTSNVVSSACRSNTQHGTKLNAWSTSTTTLLVCFKGPWGWYIWSEYYFKCIHLLPYNHI